MGNEARIVRLECAPPAIRVGRWNQLVDTEPMSWNTCASPRADAMRNVKALMALPPCRVIGEQEGSWETYHQLTGEVSTRGNLVADRM